MSDETIHISSRTRTRTLGAITKVGYSDGIVDGQTASFQTSFDIGYAQGLEFGINIGLLKARNEQQSKTNNFSDPRRINCQICLHPHSAQENIINLCNKQKEKNDEYFK